MSGLIRILFFVGDLILLNISIVISITIKGGASLIDTSDSIYLLIFSNLAWMYLSMISSPYYVSKSWGMWRLARTQCAFLLVHLLLVTSLIFFFKLAYSVNQLGLMYLLFVPSFFGWKILIFYFRKVFTPETPTKNYILLGRNSISNKIRREYLLRPDLGFNFKGYFEIEDSDLRIEKIRAFCAENEIHEIQCCVPGIKEDTLKSLINFGLDSLIKVKIIVEGDARQAIRFERNDLRSAQNMVVIPMDEQSSQLIKRIFDIVFSSAFLILVMSWVLPIIALIIKLDSKGPVFFVQLRSGKENKPFNCLKFRTMVVNHDADQKQATKDDPRITKLGSFLRRTSIDELPQFINVFNGSMSVVGPRPHMLRHTEEYAKVIEKFMGRHYVKPGITGLAQCLGYRGETRDLKDMENRVALDRYYIQNWSFNLDIKIIFLTIASLLRGSDKAY